MIQDINSKSSGDYMNIYIRVITRIQPILFLILSSETASHLGENS